jgi:hypothetical protein
VCSFPDCTGSKLAFTITKKPKERERLKNKSYEQNLTVVVKRKQAFYSPVIAVHVNLI